MFIRCPSAGRAKIEMLPNNVTSAIAYVASSSSPSTAPVIALIADTPQME